MGLSDMLDQADNERRRRSEEGDDSVPPLSEEARQQIIQAAFDAAGLARRVIVNPDALSMLGKLQELKNTIEEVIMHIERGEYRTAHNVAGFHRMRIQTLMIEVRG